MHLYWLPQPKHLSWWKHSISHWIYYTTKRILAQKHCLLLYLLVYFQPIHFFPCYLPWLHSNLRKFVLFRKINIVTSVALTFTLGSQQSRFKFGLLTEQHWSFFFFPYLPQTLILKQEYHTIILLVITLLS